MADFGGFQIKTPQEVLAEMGQQRQAIAQIQDPQAARNASIQFEMANIFGNPELKKARKVERGITAAQLEADKVKGGTDLDKESRRLSLMFDAVKDIDPLVASQISKQKLAIDSERFERKKITDTADRAARQLEINESVEARRARGFETQDDPYDRYTYFRKVDEEGKATVVPVDLDSADAEALQAKYLDEGFRQMNHEKLLDLEEPEGQEAYGKIMNPSDLEKARQGTEAFTATASGARRLVGILSRNPGANTDVAQLQSVVADVAENSRKTLEKLGKFEGISDDLAESKILAEIENWVDVDAGDRGSFQALGLNLAYSMARQLDPSGRLSDADVIFAGKMLGRFLANPSSFTRVMTEQMTRNYRLKATLGQDMKRAIPQDRLRTPQQKLYLYASDRMGGEYDLYIQQVRASGFLDEDILDELVNSDVIEQSSVTTGRNDAITDAEERKKKKERENSNTNASEFE